MSYSVIAFDDEEGEVVIAKSTDESDALSTADRVANARGCRVVVTKLATGETQEVLPASKPEDEAEAAADVAEAKPKRTRKPAAKK